MGLFYMRLLFLVEYYCSGAKRIVLLHLFFREIDREDSLSQSSSRKSVRNVTIFMLEI